MKIASHKRRSLQKILIDKMFLEKLLQAQKNKCFFCECDLIKYKAIEHLTPLSRGGDNQNYNLVYSCQSCNSKKRSKTLEEFAIQTNNFQWIDKFDLIFSSICSK
jgi:5-methylcytosine-specific restriction endonuclease McrA